MRIIEKGKMSNGTDMQIEDWSDNYDSHKKNATIAFYPVAQNSIYTFGSIPYPQKGKTFRASLDFQNEEDAREAFELMKQGKKSYMDYLDFMCETVRRKEEFLRAVTA